MAGKMFLDSAIVRNSYRSSRPPKTPRLFSSPILLRLVWWRFIEHNYLAGVSLQRKSIIQERLNSIVLERGRMRLTSVRCFCLRSNRMVGKIPQRTLSLTSKLYTLRSVRTKLLTLSLSALFEPYARST